MPVHCELRDGKHRIVEPDGKIAKTEDGNPRDGGGHDTEEECQAQANAINAGTHNSDETRDLVRFSTRDRVGTIDREKGIIYGVSILTIGEAKGHGMYVDETMLAQCVSQGELAEPVGIKCRFDHPNACSRAIGTFTGRFHHFRRDDGQTRADLHLAEAAAKSPEGDLRDYVLSLAEEDPDAFATSIVFRPAAPEIMDQENKGKDGFPPADDPYWLPHARIAKLHHCDVVDEGAANDGLFGRPDYFAEQAERWAREHPDVVGRIMSRYFEWKQQREEKKMAELEQKEQEQELAAAIERADNAESALAEANGKIAELETTVETTKTESYDEGFKAGAVVLQRRLEMFKDAAFVVETIEMSDEAAKDEYIKRTQQNQGDGKKLEFQPGGDDTPTDTFEDKVAEKEAGGMKHGEAVTACTHEFPELHKAYIERTNKERKDSE